MGEVQLMLNPGCMGPVTYAALVQTNPVMCKEFVGPSQKTGTTTDSNKLGWKNNVLGWDRFSRQLIQPKPYQHSSLFPSSLGKQKYLATSRMQHQ